MDIGVVEWCGLRKRCSVDATVESEQRCSRRWADDIGRMRGRSIILHTKLAEDMIGPRRIICVVCEQRFASKESRGVNAVNVNVNVSSYRRLLWLKRNVGLIPLSKPAPRYPAHHMHMHIYQGTVPVSTGP